MAEMTLTEMVRRVQTMMALAGPATAYQWSLDHDDTAVGPAETVAVQDVAWIVPPLEDEDRRVMPDAEIEQHKANCRYIAALSPVELVPILAGLLRVVAERQWQPIETAPEAEYVLVWLPDAGAHRAIKTTTHGHATWWRPDGHGEIVYPTLWVRLPDPPQALHETTGEAT